ncbi:protein timeless homolog isoform X1 [Branchiostoma lanceolatum]|uniref:protein timeless homolog isoform X1 n=1 Tax=Branchiostoma lanceolatum TaxID=7740 RepID=UPI0034525D66
MDLYMMNCELLATCSALGYLEGDTYHKEPDCHETVKDLIRYLRREDETRDIRQQLGASQIIQTDLIPIIKQYHDDKPLFETIIRLLVNLTQPAIVCFGKVPKDKMFRHYFLDVVSYLQGYKVAFADEEVWTVLSRKLYELLQLDWESRQEEDSLLIERILLLVRNILHVPADPEEEKRTDDDASVHDQVLWAIHQSGFDDLLKFIASSDSEQQWCMHVLEIVSLMCREQTSEQLARAGQGRSAGEKAQDELELQAVRQRELADRQAKIRALGTRHSRFGGTFVVQGMKSISDKDLIYHQPLKEISQVSFDREKNPKRKPKNRQPMKDGDTTRRSTLSIRLFLKQFCEDFLENCYNGLMRTVKDNLVRMKTQDHDETYYLWAMRFFMEFNRVHNFRVDMVSETVSVRTFHFIETNLTNFYEMMLTDKDDITSWSRRMHLALKAYNELLMTVNAMDTSKDPAVRDSANVIKSNIFYVMEYREIFLTLLRKFDETKQPKTYLKDLVETTHVFIKMLERFCKTKGHIVVQKKRKKTKRRKRTAEQGAAGPPEPSEENLNTLWDGLSGDLSTFIQGEGELPQDVAPFDATLDTPLEEQRVQAMISIQDSLRGGDPGRALATLRAAREVWPDGAFGSADISQEDEFMALREICFTALPRPAPEPSEENPEPEDEGAGEAEEEEIPQFNMTEQDFNFQDYIRRFANPQMLKPYVRLMADYRTNSAHINHCIAKMLHRVAWDCKMEGLLFQISLFRIFQRLMEDPAGSSYSELTKFAKYVLGRFFGLVTRSAPSDGNGNIFPELLFWKGAKEAYEMTEGYGSYQDVRKKKRGGAEWSPDEQEELVQWYNRFKEEGGEVDIVDRIRQNFSDPNKNRQQIIAQLVFQGVVQDRSELKRKKRPRQSAVWREEEELELQELFDKHKHSDDPVGDIISEMTEKRSKKKVVEKLLALGLVSDRKDLYKKRRRKGGKKKDKEEDFMLDDEADMAGLEEGEPVPSDAEMDVQDSSDSDSDDEQSDESDGEEETVPTLLKRLQDEGLGDQLQWIASGLERTADDRETDESGESVPIVPLTEDSETAMEHRTFQKLLKTVGLAPPANEQESFWRIPGTLSAAELRKTADVITGKEAADDLPAKKQSSSRYKALKELAKKQGKERKRGKPGRQEEEEPSTASKSGKKRARQLDSSDEDDDESITSGSSKRSRKDSSNNDMEESMAAEDKPSEEAKVTKKALESDSDSDEDNVPLRQIAHARRRIESSDSEEDK